MNRKYLVTSAIIGGLAVGLGAFGAHGLESLLSADRLDIYKTGNLYHHIFSVFLLILAFASTSYNVKLSFYSALVGIVFFSGSLYLLACKTLIIVIPTSVLGPITPLGGLCFIAAWIGLVFTKKKAEV